MDIIEMKNNPKNILVLKIAKISNPFESLREKICVINKTDITKITKYSRQKIFKENVMIKNQKDNPTVTARLLKRGDDISIQIG